MSRVSRLASPDCGDEPRPQPLPPCAICAAGAVWNSDDCARAPSSGHGHRRDSQPGIDSGSGPSHPNGFGRGSDSGSGSDCPDAGAVAATVVVAASAAAEDPPMG